MARSQHANASAYDDAKYSKAFAYEKLGEKEKAYSLWMEIAADLRKAGYTIEAGKEEQRAKALYRPA